MIRWFEDYASDLMGGGYTPSDVRLGCAIWRQGENKRMPSPGELLAICHKVTGERRVAEVLPVPPAPPRISREERAMVADMMQRSAGTLQGVGRIDFKRLGRQPGETEVDQARRLWPGREVRPKRQDRAA